MYFSVAFTDSFVLDQRKGENIMKGGKRKLPKNLPFFFPSDVTELFVLAYNALQYQLSSAEGHMSHLVNYCLSVFYLEFF